ncbi:hypothetical protein M405DRAFT_937190 [Rhizopogon salebrosus TDB-379]|nr:hypothetical protein M405DRAFT_937190 [Rhizopogon salebrosus TDB-379]
MVSDNGLWCPGKHPVCSSCRKRSTTGTWTPAIKATKRRPRSRKRGQVSHVQTYQDMMCMDTQDDSSTLASALQIQVSSVPPVDHVASQMSVVDVGFVIFDITFSAQDPIHQDIVHMEIYVEHVDSQISTVDIDWKEFFVSDLNVPADFFRTLPPIF